VKTTEHIQILKVRAVAQVVSRWTFTAQDRVQFQTCQCGMCGGQISLDLAFLLVITFYPVITPQMLHKRILLIHHRSYINLGTDGFVQ